MPKFKLLSGIHNEGGNTYYAGDIIDSKSDLLKHNVSGSSPRYEKAAESTPSSVQSRTDQLDAMTVSQLREFAEAEEIDLGEATKKAEILAVIYASLV